MNPEYVYPSEIRLHALMSLSNIQYEVPPALKDKTVHAAPAAEGMTPWQFLQSLDAFSGKHGYTNSFQEFVCQNLDTEEVKVLHMCVMKSSWKNSAVARAVSSTKEGALNACCVKLIVVYFESRHLAWKLMKNFTDNGDQPFKLFIIPKPIRDVQSLADFYDKLVEQEQKTLFRLLADGETSVEIKIPSEIVTLDKLFPPLQRFPSRTCLSRRQWAKTTSCDSISPLKALKLNGVKLKLTVRRFTVRYRHPEDHDGPSRIYGCVVTGTNKQNCDLYVRAFANCGIVSKQACAAVFIQQYFGERKLALRVLRNWLSGRVDFAIFDPPRAVGTKSLRSKVAKIALVEGSPPLSPVDDGRHPDVPEKISLHCQGEDEAEQIKSTAEVLSTCPQDVEVCDDIGVKVDNMSALETVSVKSECSVIEVDANLETTGAHFACYKNQMEELSNNSFVESVEVVRCAVGVESGRAEVELCVNNRYSFVATSPPSSSSTLSCAGAGCGVEAAFSAVLAEALGVMGRMQRQGSPHCVIAATTPDLALLASLLQDHSGLSLDSLHLRFQFLFPSKSWVATLAMDDQTFCSKDTHNNQTEALKEVLFTFLVENLKFEQI